jgi:glycosyltransferase involved in cell wall biosynthesis
VGEFAAALIKFSMKKSEKIISLETYAPAEGSYDGLTILHGQVRSIGEPLHDTSQVSGQKVLVSGIPFLYEDRLSPLNTNVLFTTFESDKLPDFWVDSINRCYHYCCVPHAEIASVFRNSGVRVPVAVIPQGFSRLARRRERGVRAGSFILGFLGVPVRRKNLPKLYAACRALKAEKIRELELAIHVSAWYDWVDESEFREMKSDPMVKWTSGRYDDGQLAEWFDTLSCYIFPSSGEGWSYTPRESLYLGIPTILSDIPVHRELIEGNHCRAIHAGGKENADFNGRSYGQWAYIDERDIAEAIEDVYLRYSYYLQAAAEGAEWIADKWHFDEVREQLSSFIGEL